jgi:hypothetical protein
MARNLERRRQAIADALRAVMSEPSPAAAPPAPLPASPVARADVRSDLPSLRDSLAAEIVWDEVSEVPLDDDNVESPPIPPLEIAGAMSSTASLALFGHA